MAKLVIGKAPISFPLPVSVPTPNGDAEVILTAKHMKATEWARIREEHSTAVGDKVTALFDAARKDAEAAYAEAQKDVKPKKGADKPAPEEAEAAKEAAISALIKPVPQVELTRLRSDMSAALIARIASAWDLDDEFTEPVIAEMCDLYQGAAEAVFTDYNKALEGRRAKN